ncbi:MAG: 4Fe-4S dicluster domain-containing protein [Gammaproteobacteria bacterium]|nr:4Fe-4S dicluster domain-containing protein [Gammaproteobacteria bacterium]
MTKPEILITTKKSILKGLDQAHSTYRIIALTRNQERVIYDYINSSDEIELEYQPTVLSVKKFFFPQDEIILDYTVEGKVTPRIEAENLVLFGVRPCDLNGIKILDEAFAESHGDPNYLSRREKSIVIGIDCQKVCDKDAFCYKVDSNEAKGGFDIMLYDLEDRYVIQVASAKGQKFLERYFETTPGLPSDLEKALAKKKEGFKGLEPFKNLEKFPEIFEKNKDHPVWEEEGSRCLSCGSCIMVCPTCYCFDVADELALNLKKGQRMRRWDACMLSAFAEVAGGENFRPTAKERLHHRIDRKFNFLMAKHGQAVCVGCGRCVRACLADISPKVIAEKITGK